MQDRRYQVEEGGVDSNISNILSVIN